MRRIIIYATVAAIALGCRSAAVRGQEDGCEEGSEHARSNAEADAMACARPQPVPLGCGTLSNNTFRREKYDDAYDDAWISCYESTYRVLWTDADYAACATETADTGSDWGSWD